MTWTPLCPLTLKPGFDPISLAETLDGGQAFRWEKETPGTWVGQWSELLVRIKLSADGTLTWSVPFRLKTRDTLHRIQRYFGADTDWPGRVDQLPWRSDPHLRRAIEAFPGLRVLRQPMEEALLGFLCSATKRIVQIKQMVALLARNVGAEVAPGYWRLPTFAEIAAREPDDLKNCLLGFRAKYIHGTAQFLAKRSGWLAETEHLPYPEAKVRLMELPGVGKKVADCVLLFGAGKLEAFPVDTWINQTLQRRYNLINWTKPQLTQFGQAHYGPSAGLAQQFLFSWERSQTGKKGS